MPYSKNQRATAGAGSIRLRTITRKGKDYTYWEARYTAGYDPGTGKQIQRTIYHSELPASTRHGERHGGS